MTTDILTLNTPTNFQDATGIELIRLFALNLKDQYMDDPKVGALQCVLHLQTTILDTLEITEDEKKQEANEQE